MKERKTYEKPAVIFEKNLEAMAGVCNPGNDTVYIGGQPGHCKAEVASCISYQFS